MKLSRLLSHAFILLTLLTGTALAQPTIAKKTKEEKLVQNFYAELLSTMKDGQKLGFDGRYKKLSPIIKKTFNMPLMTRYAVGPTWRKTSKEKQSALINSFTNFSIATYASRFTKYTGEVFAVKGVKKSAGNSMMVHTTLTPKDEESVTLNYLIRKDKKGQIRISDVYLGGAISELATRRADFTSVIKREGIDKLIASLQEKAEAMAKK